MIELNRFGNIYGEQFGTGYAGNVWDSNGLCPTIKNEGGGGGRAPMITEPQIVAMRGRNPDNPSDRTTGSPTEQRLELNSQGISNCLTSVQKDNLVIEEDSKNKIHRVGQISNDGSQYGTVVSDDGLSPTIAAGTHGYANSCIQTGYRIRKLTPRECWRLMGFNNEDFDKASEFNSATQLYKQAGNSIVKNVLVAIFGQLFDGKENVYKQINT